MAENPHSYERSDPAIAVLLTLTALLLWAGCEHSFDPILENDRYFFSIYGYLDATADTQQVRVMPIRDQLYAGPDSIDAEVTLHHLESGNSVRMTPEFTYFGHDTLHPTGVWNFKTDFELHPSQTYRIRAERSDGQYSQVKVTIPDDFMAPVVRFTGFTGRFNGGSVIIDIDDIDHLVELDGIYETLITVPGDPPTIIRRQITVPKYHAVVQTGSGYQAVIRENWVRSYLTSRTGYIRFDLVPLQISVTAGGPDWKYFPDIDEHIIELPDGVSNVENGTGYLVGVVSKTVPFKTCYDESGENEIPCPTEPRLDR